MSDERAWLRHAETGGYFLCPIGAIQYWSPRGWVPSDPPPEVDLTQDPNAVIPTDEPAQATAPEPQPAKTGKAGKDQGAGE